MNTQRPPHLWFDVEDLFHFADRNARPTGIQRVCFEIYRAALADPALRGRVGFVRHATAERGFVEADWAMLSYRFRRVTDRRGEAEPTLPPGGTPDRAAPAGSDDPVPDTPLPPAAAQPAGTSTGAVLPGPDPAARSFAARGARRIGRLVPRRISRPGFLFAVMQAQAGAALADALRLAAADRGRRAAKRVSRRLRATRLRLPSFLRPAPGGEADEEPPPLPIVPRRLPELAARGDVLVVLGSPWFETDYSELAGHARGRLGLRLAVLMHDVIPVRRPEWVDRGTVRVYRDWYRTVLPLADLVLANSRATADDVTLWCARDNIRLNRAVLPLPIGTGFGPTDGPAAPSTAAAPLPGRLAGREYVLFVSTIEARKNHLLLFRAWRRLLEEMPPGTVPDLVFAGRVGWLVDDLMDQIRNSRHLDGRLHVLEGLDDASLRAVYAGCLFTVFPSFYEGWGLPVSESMAMGRPCLCSSATALPEAGGTLARYFDPFDLNDAVAVIRATIEDRAGLRRWREQVAREFRPVGWGETATALAAALDRPPAAAPD